MTSSLLKRFKRLVNGIVIFLFVLSSGYLVFNLFLSGASAAVSSKFKVPLAPCSSTSTPCVLPTGQVLGSVSGVYQDITGDVHASGNMGVGTISPGQRMVVIDAGNGTNDTFQVFPLNLTQGIGIGYNHITEIGSNTNNAMYVDSKGTGALILQNHGGNVGVGTGSPRQKLDVNGDAIILNDLLFNHGGSQYSAVYDDGTSNLYVNPWGEYSQVFIGPNGTPTTLYASGSIGTGGNLVADYGATSSNLYCFTGYTNCISAWPAASATYWGLSGNNLTPSSTAYNVGIGTANPGATLDVTGNIHSFNNGVVDQATFGGSTNSTSSYVYINSAAAQQSSLSFQSAGTQESVIYRPASSNDLRFYTTGGSDVMSITQGGNVGVETVTPKSKLDVSGGMAVGTANAGVNTAPSNGAIIQGQVGIGFPTYWGATSPAPNTQLDVETDTLGGPAINANNSGDAIHASSNSNIGVLATGGTGVKGIGPYDGVWGVSAGFGGAGPVAGKAVYGNNNSNASGTPGYGGYFTSDTGLGVYGNTNGALGVGGEFANSAGGTALRVDGPTSTTGDINISGGSITANYTTDSLGNRTGGQITAVRGLFLGTAGGGPLYENTGTESDVVLIRNGNNLQLQTFNTTPGTSNLYIDDHGGNTRFRFDTAANGKAYTSGTGTWTNGGADVAEYYPSNEQLAAGTLVSVVENPSFDLLNSISKATTIIAKANNSKNVIGIVSTAPSVMMGTPLDDKLTEHTENMYKVALTGRVPTIVTATNGDIAVGDRLSLSNTSGVASKLTHDGYSVAIALQPFKATNCQQALSVENVSWPKDDPENSLHPCFVLSDGTYVGKIMALVNLSWYADPSHAAGVDDIISSQQKTINDLEAKMNKLEQQFSTLQNPR